MLDIVLLQVIKKREDYDEYYPIIRDRSLDPKIRTLVYDFGEFFKTHEEHDEIDWDLFPTWWRQVRHPNIKKDELDYYETIFEKVQKDPSEKNKKSLAKQLIETDFATVVTNKGYDTLDGKMNGSAYVEFVEDEVYKTRKVLDTFTEVPWVEADITELSQNLSYENGLKFTGMPCLDESYGSMLAGDFIILGAFTDTGKTSFAVDQFVACQLKQIVNEMNKGKWFYNRPILWFNNEGDEKKIKMYSLQSFFGCDRDRIAKNPEGAKEAFNKALGDEDLFKVVACQGWHIKQADRIIKKLNPCIVIYDMLDNFSGFEDTAGTSDQRYRVLYNHARDNAKIYDHVAIATSQCTGDAEGLERIPMSMLAGSRVAKQSTADLMIMIGRSLQSAKQNFRYIYTPKNKGETQQVSNPDRYTNQEVEFRGDIKRYIDPKRKREE